MKLFCTFALLITYENIQEIPCLYNVLSGIRHEVISHCIDKGVFFMENKEILWKPIPGFSRYHASTEGDIKTFNWYGSGREMIMKPAKDKGGYMRTMIIGDDGINHTVKVHRIIAITFMPNPENKETVNHKNGIKHDNRLINLEWATRSENLIHAFSTQLMKPKKGELNGCATLTDKQVIEIRKNYVYGKTHKEGETKKQIAARYGTTFSVIKAIVQGQTWKHLL